MKKRSNGQKRGKRSEAGPPGRTALTAGFKGYLTESEEQTLAAVAGRVSRDGRRVMRRSKIPDEDDDTFLLRFCRARKFDEEKTMEMLENHFSWYRSYRVASLMRQSEAEIMGCDPATIHALYPRGFHGWDKLGRPVNYQRPGLMNIPALLKMVSLETYLRYEVWQQERGLQLMARRARAAGRHIEAVTTIIDLKGLAMRHFSKETYSLLKVRHLGACPCG